jgi:hypothetical protein
VGFLDDVHNDVSSEETAALLVLLPRVASEGGIAQTQTTF